MESLKLMSEEDIRQYFIHNGGIVRNTDIVTYFRAYLSNPATRDEARIVFKTYVNKLAAVKVENGEKFLVLKRQYFPPIDDKGNPKSSLSSYPSTSSISSSQYAQGYNGPGPGQQHYQHQQHQHHSNNSPYGSGQSSAHPYNNYPGAPSNNNYLRRQNSNSQPQLYGSQFSLNSNYMDPYANPQTNYPPNPNQSNSNINLQGSSGTPNFYPASSFSQSNPSVYHQHQNSNININNNTLQQQHQHQTQYQKSQTQLPSQTNINYNQNQGPTSTAFEYPPEYGLPTVPPPPPQAQGNTSLSSPPRRFLSPQNSYGSNSSNSGSPSSRAPPPYRAPPGPSRAPPPPVVGRFPNSNFSSPPNPHGISRRSSMTSMVGLPYHRTNSVPAPATGQGSYYSSTQNVNALPDPSQAGMFQYHRSASELEHQQIQQATTDTFVTGLPGAVHNSATSPPIDQNRYFESLGIGAPPVPPRSRRSVERSPSAANSLSSSSSSNVNSQHQHGGMRNRLTKMEVDKMNGNQNQQNQPQQIQIQQNGMPMPISPPSGSGSGPTMQEQMSIRMEKDSDNNGMTDSDEKENIDNLQIDDGSNLHQGKNSIKQNGSSEVEQKISVKERMQTFNRIASESEVGVGVNAKVPSARSRREIAAKHESGDFDTASLSSFGYSHVQLDPKSKDWMMRAMKCDYPVLNKMAQENPALVRRKDMNYTALHWSAKHGNLECVKLLAGTYKAEVNIKSNGGYTPLHLAAQFARQEVYDVLIKTYNADANTRDHSGKKPMQYLVRQDASMSIDTFKKLKEKRRNTEQQRERDSSFLRIGSLNVKVKSTREAFGYLLGKSTSSSSIERMHKNWGSADNLPENEEKDKQMMPPPVGGPRLGMKPSKRRPKRSIDSHIIKESKSDSDSDSAFGFGSDWVSPVRD